MPIVGLLVPTMSNLYYPFLAQNVEIYARSLGLTVVLQNTMRCEESEIQSFDYLRSIGAEGILCLFTPKAQIPPDIPAVIVGESAKDVNTDTVSLNSYTAGRMATEHLLALGHRDIAYISTPLTNMTDARRKRMDGIRDAMREAGLDSRLTVLVSDNENETLDGKYEFDCGSQMTERLLACHPECTAIIAVNDMTAMGCMSTLNNRGVKIPDEMSILGFDNLYLDNITAPQLTSVDQMAFHGCKVGLGILLEKMREPAAHDMPVFMEYTPQLHVRGTTDVKKDK